MSRRPEPISEIVIETLTDKSISIHVASKRAFDWIDKEVKAFSSGGYRYGTSESSAHMIVQVSPCFDINEVILYLINPQYEKQSLFFIVEKNK